MVCAYDVGKFVHAGGGGGGCVHIGKTGKGVFVWGQEGRHRIRDDDSFSLTKTPESEPKHTHRKAVKETT